MVGLEQVTKAEMVSCLV